MAFTIGHCTNVDYCSTASARRDVMVGLGEAFVCPVCGNKLAGGSVAPAPARSFSRAVVVGVAAVAVLGGYAAALLRHPSATATQAPAAAAGMAMPAPQSVAAAAPIAPATDAAPAAALVPPARTQAAAADLAAAETVLLRIAGENGTTLQLAPRLAAALLTSVGDTDITTGTDAASRTITVHGMRGATREAITITTETSAAALQSLATGQADLALSTRHVTPAERAAMSALGDMTSPEAEHVLGLDGIAVVVNPANKIGALTVGQLRAIYSGAVRDWSQLGGTPGPIDVWTRQEGGGTRAEFVKFALGDTPMLDIPAARVSDDDGPIVAAVGSDRNAIAYISQTNIGAARALAIADTGLQPLLPTPANLATEEYPLTRRLYLYSAAAPKNPFVARLIEYALADKGQDLVGQAGFVSLALRQAAVSPPVNASDPYRQLVGSAQRLSVDFHFRAGSNDLDNRGLRDVDRVADLLTDKNWPSERLILVGFADNTGTPQSNGAIARERAETVAAIFANRGIVPGAVLAFGAEAPIGDNATAEGRDKNRRVEVFIRQGASGQAPAVR